MKNAILGAALVGAWLMSATAQAQTAQPIPAWDHQIQGTARWVVLTDFANAAVLDKETGLVWERTVNTADVTFFDGTMRCLNLAVGGRKGWRLPSIYELMTMIDPSVPSPGPTLPAGLPFKNVSARPLWFWSSTKDMFGNVPQLTYYMTTFDGSSALAFPSTSGMHAWCVRAPSTESQL
jgi:hypothetical protein